MVLPGIRSHRICVTKVQALSFSRVDLEASWEYNLLRSVKPVFRIIVSYLPCRYIGHRGVHLHSCDSRPSEITLCTIEFHGDTCHFYVLTMGEQRVPETRAKFRFFGAVCSEGQRLTLAKEVKLNVADARWVFRILARPNLLELAGPWMFFTT